jgi:hypothetical protein
LPGIVQPRDRQGRKWLRVLHVIQSVGGRVAATTKSNQKQTLKQVFGESHLSFLLYLHLPAPDETLVRYLPELEQLRSA